MWVLGDTVGTQRQICQNAECGGTGPAVSCCGISQCLGSLLPLSPEREGLAMLMPAVKYNKSRG